MNLIYHFKENLINNNFKSFFFKFIFKLFQLFLIFTIYLYLYFELFLEIIKLLFYHVFMNGKLKIWKCTIDCLNECILAPAHLPPCVFVSILDAPSHTHRHHEY